VLKVRWVTFMREASGTHVNGRAILNYILVKMRMRVESGFSWLRIVSSGVLF
jgi:hypothetical protein